MSLVAQSLSRHCPSCYSYFSLSLVPSASCCLNMVLCAGRWHCRYRIIYTLICSFGEHSGRYSLLDKTPRLIKSSRPQARFLTRPSQPHTIEYPSADVSHIYIYYATCKSFSPQFVIVVLFIWGIFNIYGSSFLFSMLSFLLNNSQS